MGAINLRDLDPTYYRRERLPSILSNITTDGRRTVSISKTSLVTDGYDITIQPINIDLGIAANWDSTATDYTVAANRAGKDFYIYATAVGLILSANATVPTGYTGSNSRRVGGFHCLCLSVGTISGHTLTGFLTGDILPASIWDLSFRSSSLIGNIGAVWHSSYGMWYDIYLQSGTGSNTTSVFGGTITDTRTYWDHNDDLGAVGKRMLFDNEFSVVAYGSPEATNITGSSDPATTGGHVDTGSRRIISNIGCEDCTGVVHQWIDGGHVYRNDDASYAGAWSWKAAGSRGQQYTQGANGAMGLLAGGFWNIGLPCGSRCRTAAYARSTTFSNYGSRGCAKSV